MSRYLAIPSATSPHTAHFTNYKAVEAAPVDWLPWNYEDALARLDQRHPREA
jgi:hypothetical protein